MTSKNYGIDLPTDVYWAAVETERLAATLAARRQIFWDAITRTGLLELWRRSHHTYYGTDGEGGWARSVAVTYIGEDRQTVYARVNHYRSIAQALIAQATGIRPAFEARAVNTDVKSLRTAPLATGVVDYAYRIHEIEDLNKQETEAATKYGSGHSHLRWDPYAGRVRALKERPVYAADGVPQMEERVAQQVEVDALGVERIVEVVTQEPVTEQWPEREGDIAPLLLQPHEVVRDLEPTKIPWLLVPHRVNAWDLAARYPQHREAILAQRGSEQWPRSIWGASHAVLPEVGDDDLVTWCFYHPASDALPGGRYSVVVGDVVLHDEEFRFDEIPVYGQTPMRHDGRGVGYSPMWDLLCLQEVYDAVFSAIVSQFDAGSGSNVVSPKGSDVSVEQLTRALQLIEYEVQPGAPGGGKPETLDLFKLKEDHFKLLDILQKLGETLSGINSVVRGDPGANLKSGAALALVQSLSAYFSSGLQSENARGHERKGTGILKLYKRFASTKRTAEIVGRSNRTELIEWTREDLAAIDRVTIELGNPLMRQRSGIQQIAESLLEHDMFEDRDEYLLFLDTGRLEPAYSRQKRRALQVEEENEAIQDGRPIKALWGDDHPMHIERHLSVLDDPQARFDDALVRRVQEHVDEHKALWLGMDPMIAAALGVMPPPPPLPMPGAMPPPKGGPLGPEMPAPGRALPGGVPSSGPAPTDLPFMPTNPLTSERAPSTPTNPT